MTVATYATEQILHRARERRCKCAQGAEPPTPQANSSPTPMLKAKSPHLRKTPASGLAYTTYAGRRVRVGARLTPARHRAILAAAEAAGAERVAQRIAHPVRLVEYWLFCASAHGSQARPDEPLGRAKRAQKRSLTHEGRRALASLGPQKRAPAKKARSKVPPSHQEGILSSEEIQARYADAVSLYSSWSSCKNALFRAGVIAHAGENVRGRLGRYRLAEGFDAWCEARLQQARAYEHALASDQWHTVGEIAEAWPALQDHYANLPSLGSALRYAGFDDVQPVSQGRRQFFIGRTDDPDPLWRKFMAKRELAI